MVIVGIAMLQGSRHAHIRAIQAAAKELGLAVEVRELRTAADLTDEVQALLLPGGESTVMRLTGNDAASRLLPAIFDWLRADAARPVLATCAGAILLADPQDGGAPLIDVEIDRNAWGSQVDSFEAELECGFPGIFIRAPRYKSADCDVICKLGEEIVGVRQLNRIALTFHPELSGDVKWHRTLLEAVA